MRKIILPLLFILCATLHANAQSFLDNLQKSKQGEGKVTVTQSKEIDNLVDGTNVTKNATPAQKANPTPKAATPKTAADKAKPATKPATSKEVVNRDKTHALAKDKEREHEREVATERKTENRKPEKTPEETPEMSIPTVDMSKKVMLRSHKVSGYRVQAFAGGNTRDDKNRAQQIGSAIKMKYPDQPVYVHFYSPRWICRVGNYRSYGEAQKMLSNIRNMGYKGATIVKGMITVQY